MMSVKLIDTFGNEEVFECSRVAFAGDAFNVSNKKVVFIDRVYDNATVKVDSGTIYVMNSAGKTITLYEFENPPKVSG